MRQHRLEIACIDCDIGKFNVPDGSRVQSAHRDGTLSLVSGSQIVDTCEKCKTGKYNDGIGVVECKSCPINTYNPEPGSTSSLLVNPAPKMRMVIPKSPEGSSRVAACTSSGKVLQCDTNPAERPIDNVCTLCPEGFYGTGDGKGCVSRSIVVIVLKKLLLMEFEIFIN